MENEDIYDQFLQDVLQVNNDHVRLYIAVFIESFVAIVTTTDEDIDTFVHDTHSPNNERAASSSTLIVPRVSTSIKVVSF